jgi:hypothetical protein
MPSAPVTIPCPLPVQRKQCGNNAGLRVPKINTHSHLPSLDTVTFSISPLISISSPPPTHCTSRKLVIRATWPVSAFLSAPPASIFFSQPRYLLLRNSASAFISAKVDHDPGKRQQRQFMVTAVVVVNTLILTAQHFNVMISAQERSAAKIFPAPRVCIRIRVPLGLSNSMRTMFRNLPVVAARTPRATGVIAMLGSPRPSGGTVRWGAREGAH